MVRDSKLELILKRNGVLSSVGPIPIQLTKRHFEALIKEVHLTGKTFNFLIRGKAMGCLERIPVEVQAKWD